MTGFFARVLFFAMICLASPLSAAEGQEPTRSAGSEAGLLGHLNALIVDVRAKLELIGNASASRAIDDVVTTLSGGKGIGVIVEAGGTIAVLIIAALILEWPIRARLRRLKAQVAASSIGARGAGFAITALLDLSAIGGFFLLAVILFASLADDHPVSRLFLIAGCLIVVFLRSVLITVSWIFDALPVASALRPWATAIGLTAAYGWLATTFLATAGIGEGAHIALCLAAGTLVAVEIGAGIWWTRKLVDSRFERMGDRASLMLRPIWVNAASAATLLVWSVWALCFLTVGERSLASGATLAALAALCLVGWRDWRGTGAALTVAILLGLLWSRDAEDLLFTWTAGKLVVTVGGGLVALRAINIAFARFEPTVRDSDEEARPRSRFETVVPLVRAALLVVTILLATMTTLSTLGVDTTPLLAGAGVIGLAIGFGAQTLIRDIITGLFFLFEDAFRIGEYVDVGLNKRGEVEAISPRSIRLRHHRGAVHRVPFSEIRSLTNHSRDWVIDKILIQVAYDTDVEAVRKLVKAIGQELLDDPEVGPLMLAPLKSQGISIFGESGIQIRLKFTSAPSHLFLVRREVMKRLHLAFRAAGIAFAHPQRFITVLNAGESESDDRTKFGAS